MKKIITFLIIASFSLSLTYGQVGTADIAIENPRIEGSNFYFDIYFKRTNDVTEWYLANDPTTFPYAHYAQSSWVINMTTSAFTGAVVVYEDPTYIAGKYTTSVSFEGALNRINITSNRTVGLPIPSYPNFPLDTWFLAYTVEMTIANTALNSGSSWNITGTNLITPGTLISVTETRYDSDCDIALNTKCWVGNASAGDWNVDGNWNPSGVPLPGDNIIYPNNPASEITLMNGIDFGETNEIRVNHRATLSIPANKGITANGQVVLKGGINIILEGGSGVGTLSSAFIPKSTIDYNSYSLENGQIEVHRTLYYEDTDLDYYHHQVAAPVGGVRLGDWDMIHEYSYAYEFDGASQNWVNIHSPFRTTPSGYGFILSLYGASGLPTGTQDNVFYNNLVLSTTSVTVADNAIGDLTLVGNPFTAPIDWEYMNPQTGVSDVVYIWDPAAGNYKSYVEGSGAGSVSARYIQPGQAFFIEASSTTATTFAMDPAARTQNIEPFLKSYMPSLLRMYTEGGNTTDDEVYIKLIDADVTGGHDSGFDALEWPSDYGEQATELYTVGSDGNHLTIDARPLSPDQTSVPLSFKAAVDADYNLVADLESIESFSLGTDIFLEDTHHPEQAWIDLREFNSYTFNASPEDDYNRFMIHFHVKDFGIDEFGESPINIYSDRTDAIIKNNSDQIIKEIHIFDVTGNLMTVKSGVNDEITRMFISSSTGYYVVKVITDKAVYSEKVLITK